ncbi:MAG: ComF family protein [Selenomonadaceae bacterium]|nr:ComF family protein [Selenomonadaceae bacterium]
MRLLDEIVDFLYPPHCPKCNAYVEARGAWCSSCLQETAHVQRLPLSVELVKLLEGGAWALGHYRGGLQMLIRGLKYQGRKENLPYLRTFLQACQGEMGMLHEGMVAVPVPLHPEKERQRGFNQVELIFKEWLSGRGIPMERMLCRSRPTRAQYGLSAEERRSNLKHAFSLAEGAEVRGKDLLLVDDIMTTGTTFHMCAEELKKAGAARILGLVLASDRT